MSAGAVAAREGRARALWQCPFRPFFLATAAYALCAVAGWLGVLVFAWPLAGDHPPMQWHSHEMLFGMVAAAVAGFLLTAMCNWTGARSLSGTPLKALLGLWLAGRLAMWMSAVLPHWLVALIDLSFLAVVAGYSGFIIIGSGNRRNLPLVIVVTVLGLANALFHAGLATGDAGLLRGAELGTIGLIVLLMVIIGGRITPAFTRNWMMRRQMDPSVVRSRSWLDWTATLATIALIVLLLADAPSGWIAALAGVAGAANLARVAGWSGWRTLGDPLVWILHAGYAWIALGLILMALGRGFGLVADTVWLHALGPGAMGVLIMGVMTRVSLGHTGRPLKLPSGAVAAYVLIIAAALVRVATAAGWLPWLPGLIASTAAWVGAFAVFLALYLPILAAPRADGRPG